MTDDDPMKTCAECTTSRRAHMGKTCYSCNAWLCCWDCLADHRIDCMGGTP